MESNVNRKDGKKGWSYSLDEMHRVFLMMTYVSLATQFTSKVERRKQAIQKFKETFPALGWYPSHDTLKRKIDLIWKDEGRQPPEPYDDQRELIIHPRTVVTEENKERFESRIVSNPRASITSSGNILGISKKSSQRIVKELGYSKFKLRQCQHLPMNSWKRRLEACKRFSDKMNSDPEWLENVWFSDEKHFTIDHTFNHHNDGFLSKAKPSLEDVKVEKKPYPKKVTIFNCMQRQIRDDFSFRMVRSEGE